MAELKWIDPPKEGAPEAKKESMLQVDAPTQMSLPDPKKEDNKKKMQPILKVVFKLNETKPLKEKLR